MTVVISRSRYVEGAHLLPGMDRGGGYHALIEEYDDHGCAAGFCWDEYLLAPFDRRDPLNRPPFPWAGAPRRWPTRKVECGEQ